MSQILLTWGAYPGRDKKSASDAILERSRNRQRFYELCIKMITWAKVNNVRLIMENPLGKHSFLQRDFITAPKVVDMDRSLRGDYFAKPTAYWFINCDPTDGFTFQQIHSPIRVKKDVRSKSPKGVCSEERSMISPDYARNFICDFVLGKSQPDIDPQLF